MSPVTPIGGGKERDVVDVHEDLETQLRDIYAVSELVAAASFESVDVDGMNRAGYALFRMTERARAMLEELWELQKRSN